MIELFKASASPITAVGNVLDKLFTSDEEKLDKKALLLKLNQKPQLALNICCRLAPFHRLGMRYKYRVSCVHKGHYDMGYNGF